MPRPDRPLTPVDPESPLCSSGKRGYRTEDLARRMLARTRAMCDGGLCPNRAGRTCYRCTGCGWWHLTSAVRRRRRRSDFVR